ncbi:MAG: hypothetical protein KDK38_14150, partial [Leptospiraceae bacterium]|nr:hypothetical protein [Leptospiraceae bacterium]
PRIFKAAEQEYSSQEVQLHHEIKSIYDLFQVDYPSLASISRSVENKRPPGYLQIPPIDDRFEDQYAIDVLDILNIIAGDSIHEYRQIGLEMQQDRNGSYGHRKMSLKPGLAIPLLIETIAHEHAHFLDFDGMSNLRAKLLHESRKASMALVIHLDPNLGLWKMFEKYYKDRNYQSGSIGNPFIELGNDLESMVQSGMLMHRKGSSVVNKLVSASNRVGQTNPLSDIVISAAEQKKSLPPEIRKIYSTHFHAMLRELNAETIGHVVAGKKSELGQNAKLNQLTLQMLKSRNPQLTSIEMIRGKLQQLQLLSMQ